MSIANLRAPGPNDFDMEVRSITADIGIFGNIPSFTPGLLDQQGIVESIGNGSLRVSNIANYDINDNYTFNGNSSISNCVESFTLNANTISLNSNTTTLTGNLNLSSINSGVGNAVSFLTLDSNGDAYVTVQAPSGSNYPNPFMSGVPSATGTTILQINGSNEVVQNNTLPTGTVIPSPSFSGNTIISGTLLVNGTNNPNKFEVANNSGNVALNCNTNSMAVTTLHNILDDGSGNSTISGILTTNLLASSVIQTNTSKQLFASNTLSGLNISNSNISGTITTTLTSNSVVQTDGSGNLIGNNTLPTLSGALRTSHNTLDDGLGNVTLSGIITTGLSHNSLLQTNGSGQIIASNTIAGFSPNSLIQSNGTGQIIASNTVTTTPIFNGGATVNGTLSCPGTNVVFSGANSTFKFLVRDASANVAFGIDTTVDKVTTLHNTLDDGSGNATVSGILTTNILPNTIVQTNASKQLFGSNTLSGLTISNSNITGTISTALSPNSIVQTDVSGNLIVSNTLAQNIIKTGTTNIKGANNTNKFFIQDGLNNTAFNVNTSTDAVTTRLNTLDDGSGNMQISGFLHATSMDGALTISQANNANKLQVNNNSSATIFNVNTTGNSVTTLFNTLDDGSGNMTLHGQLNSNTALISNNLTVSNIITTLNGNVSGTLSVTTQLNAGTCVLGGPGGVAIGTTGGGSYFRIVDSTGSLGNLLKVEETVVAGNSSNAIMSIGSAINFNSSFSGTAPIGNTTSGPISLPPLTPYCYYYYASTIAGGTTTSALTLPGAAIRTNIMYITGLCVMNWNNDGTHYITVPLNSQNALQNWSVIVGSTTVTTDTFTISTNSSWNLSNGPARFYVWFWVSNVTLI